MKKILIFSIAYLPFLSGAELAIKEITGRMPEFEFDMITSRFDKNLPNFERIGNINIYRVGFGKNNPTMADLVKFSMMVGKYLFPFLACFKAYRLHRKKKYDLIWSLMANYAGFAALFFKTINSHIPFLLTLQEGDPIEYIKKRVGVMYPLFKNIFTKADFIQAISNYLADFAKEMNAKSEIVVVPNGVDVKKFSRTFSQIKLDKIREKLNIKREEKVIISLSRLVKKNGLTDIIDALSILRKGGLNIKLIIAFDGPLKEALEKKVRKMNFENYVLFLGRLINEDIPQYLAISDVFVRPSLSEGQGVSFLEAMAARIPIIGTKVGGIPDFLKDSETGLFCEVNNPQSIAEKVKLLLENSELREKIVKNAKEMVLRDYDWNLIAEKMKNVFNKLIL